jgi:hypothetical protein
LSAIVCVPVRANFANVQYLGLGDTLTTKEIAKAFSSVYNTYFEVNILGSLEDKIQKSKAEKAKDPENHWAGLFE